MNRVGENIASGALLIEETEKRHIHMDRKAASQTMLVSAIGLLGFIIFTVAFAATILSSVLFLNNPSLYRLLQLIFWLVVLISDILKVRERYKLMQKCYALVSADPNITVDWVGAQIYPREYGNWKETKLDPNGRPIAERKIRAILKRMVKGYVFPGAYFNTAGNRIVFPGLHSPPLAQSKERGPSFCSDCGADISGSSTFCTHCGAQLDRPNEKQ